MTTSGDTSGHPVTEALRVFALRYPGTTQTGVCVNLAVKAGSKSFVFLGTKPDRYEVRVKLQEAFAEAERLSVQEPDRYHPGKHGWTLVRFATDDRPPGGLLERWVDESYRLLAPRKLVAELPEPGFPPA